MTAHELARILLDAFDLPVVIEMFDGPELVIQVFQDVWDKHDCDESNVSGSVNSPTIEYIPVYEDCLYFNTLSTLMEKK